MIRAVVLGVGLALVTVTTGAQTPSCDALTGAERRLAEKLLTTEYLYDCCDDTIARCLQAQPTCALAVRLADNICGRVTKGQDEARIRRALSRRARSMVGGDAPAEIDLSAAPAVGDPDAPVTVVVYACARCPYCSKLVPSMYQAITSGPIHEQARLVLRVFPIRGHEGSTEAGLGFVAASHMGGFWRYALHAYSNFDAYTEEQRLESAAAAGLDRDEFEARLADPATRDVLVESKKEGLVNGVEETPTFFVNGRRWAGDLELEELVDAIQEEAERAKGDVWVTR